MKSIASRWPVRTDQTGPRFEERPLVYHTQFWPVSGLDRVQHHSLVRHGPFRTVRKQNSFRRCDAFASPDHLSVRRGLGTLTWPTIPASSITSPLTELALQHDHDAVVGAVLAMTAIALRSDFASNLPRTKRRRRR